MFCFVLILLKNVLSFSVMDEIEDRINFLDRMKTFGASKNYEQCIQQEIAKKIKELEITNK